MNKRGISSIIATLILVLLTIVLVGIVWAVISNIVKSGSQQVSSQFGTLFLDLKIQNVVVDSSTGNLSVTVTRNPGQGNLTGVAFAISDGENTKVIKETAAIDQLETKTFTFTPSDLGSILLVKEVDIAPIVQGQVGQIVDSRIFSNSQILQNLGAVSWWKLDGDASDEIGGNNGNLIGGVNFVQGKFGQAANFNGSSTAIIEMNSFANLPLGNNPRTMLAWIKPSGYPDTTYNGIVAYSGGGAPNDGSLLSIQDTGMLSQAFWNNDAYQTTGAPATLNAWNQVAFTYSGGTAINFYMNGKFVQTSSLTSGIAAATTSTGFLPRIGCTDAPGRCFDGQIEDVMIFNQALTQNQITAIYQMNLTSS